MAARRAARGITRVCGYIRVSTTEQAEHGHGLSAQETQVKAQAIAKGWTEPVIFKDEGISGTKDVLQRPGLTALMKALEAGEYDAVIVPALDRLGRTTKLVLNLIDTFSSLNVEFVSCREQFDTSTAMGKAMLSFVAVLSQLERDLTAERTSAALQELKRQNKYAGGRIPYGYTREAVEMMVIDADAAEVIRYIFSLRMQNKLSMDKIAQRLNRESVGTSKGAVKWYASSVKAILDNREIYEGKTTLYPRIIY